MSRSEWSGAGVVVLLVFVLAGGFLLLAGQSAAGVICLALGLLYVPQRALRGRTARRASDRPDR